jgi:hypothetical protein
LKSNIVRAIIKNKAKKMPKTLLGKYAIVLLIIFLLCLITIIIGVNSGITPRDSILARLIGVSMLITGLATFITGVISLKKYEDRSPAIKLTIIFGAIAILIIVIEVMEIMGL